MFEMLFSEISTFWGIFATSKSENSPSPLIFIKFECNSIWGGVAIGHGGVAAMEGIQFNFLGQVHFQKCVFHQIWSIFR